jgi:hypothetical protein
MTYTSISIFRAFASGLTIDFSLPTWMYGNLEMLQQMGQSDAAAEVPLPINEALVITPVAQKFKKAGMPDSKRDYLEQCNRKCQGLPLCWDDSKNNTAMVGDLFGFWHYNNGVEIHQIKAVHSPLHRLGTWSDNVGQGDRNVIMLSPMICKIPWDIWFPEDKLGGAKRCMGTVPVKKNLDLIVAYVRGIHM